MTYLVNRKVKKRSLPVSLLFISTILLCVSCAEKEKTFNLILTDTYVVSDSNTSFYLPVFGRTVQFDNKELLMTVGETPQTLTLWDLHSNGVHRKLDISHFPSQPIFNFSLLSGNTLLLALNAEYLPEKHSHSLLMMDSNQQVMDSFAYTGAPVKLGALSSASMFAFNMYFPLVYDNYRKRVISELVPYRNLCDSAMDATKLPILGFSYRSSSNRPFQPLEFEDLENHLETICKYPRDFNKTYGAYIQEDSVIIFGFPYTSAIYSLDIRSGSIQKCGKTKTYSLEEEIPFEKINRQLLDENDDPGSGKYSLMAYNSKSRILFRLNRQAVPPTSGTTERNFPLYTLTAYDHEFRLIGEQALPHGCSEVLLTPWNDGVLIYDRKASEQKGVNVIYHYEMGEVDKHSTYAIRQKVADLRSGIIEKGPQDYFNSFTQNVSEKTFILIPLENSCGSCLKTLFSALTALKEPLSNGNVHVILIGSNRTGNPYVQRFLGDSSQTLRRHMHFDQKYLFKSYYPEWTNPRRIKFDKNGRMLSDKIYNPDDMPQLLMEIDRDLMFTNKK